MIESLSLLGHNDCYLQLHDDFSVKFHIPICALDLVYLARTMTTVDLEDWWLDVVEHIFEQHPDGECIDFRSCMLSNVELLQIKHLP